MFWNALCSPGWPPIHNPLASLLSTGFKSCTSDRMQGFLALAAPVICTQIASVDRDAFLYSSDFLRKEHIFLG